MATPAINTTLADVEKARRVLLKQRCDRITLIMKMQKNMHYLPMYAARVLLDIFGISGLVTNVVRSVTVNTVPVDYMQENGEALLNLNIGNSHTLEIMERLCEQLERDFPSRGVKADTYVRRVIIRRRCERIYSKFKEHDIDKLPAYAIDIFKHLFQIESSDLKNILTYGQMTFDADEEPIIIAMEKMCDQFEQNMPKDKPGHPLDFLWK